MTDIVHLLLKNLVILWISAGFLDWLCHRSTDIETTAGIEESLFHILQLCVAGLGFAIGVFFPISLASLLLLSCLWSAHQFATWLELRYVVGKRVILPVEQMIHSFMELLPLAAIALLAVLLADPEVQSVNSVSFVQRWDDNPRFATLSVAGIFLFVIAPFLEEFIRCLRARQRKARGAAQPH